MTFTEGESGPGSNDNKGIFHVPHISFTRVSSSDGLVSYSRLLSVGLGLTT